MMKPFYPLFKKKYHEKQSKNLNKEISTRGKIAGSGMESSKVSGKNRDVGNPEKQYRIKVK